MIKIYVTSVPVNNQDKALKFYTEKLGFVKKTDVPLGEYKIFFDANVLIYLFWPHGFPALGGELW